MKRAFGLTLFCFALYVPFHAHAVSKTFLCDPPQGTRIDYFTVNNINLQNNTFIMGRDRISGMQPRVTLDDALKNVSFVIGDVSELKTPPKAGNMNVLMYDEHQISFSGLISGAPILGTFYPAMGVLIYSQQSIWPGPNYQGVRAVMFYTKCRDEAANQAVASRRS